MRPFVRKRTGQESPHWRFPGRGSAEPPVASHWCNRGWSAGATRHARITPDNLNWSRSGVPAPRVANNALAVEVAVRTELKLVIAFDLNVDDVGQVAPREENYLQNKRDIILDAHQANGPSRIHAAPAYRVNRFALRCGGIVSRCRGREAGYSPPRPFPCNQTATARSECCPGGRVSCRWRAR